MIDVKDAIKTAMQFVAETFGEVVLSSLRLEEVDRTVGPGNWHITVSFVRGSGPGALAAVLGTESRLREYKTITVDSAGAVKSVKIRQLA